MGGRRVVREREAPCAALSYASPVDVVISLVLDVLWAYLEIWWRMRGL
jgi:hypothetical protein